MRAARKNMATTTVRKKRLIKGKRACPSNRTEYLAWSNNCGDFANPAVPN